MRKLTVEEKQNLTDNKDIIGEIALELSQMDREHMKVALNKIILINIEIASEQGNLYDEKDIIWGI